jgi:hypothetical protein
VRLTSTLIGSKETGGKAVCKEGVTDASLINHENDIGKGNAAVVMGVGLVLGVFVDGGEEIFGPLSWEEG